MYTGSAPAKAILMGEHFVVHGAPALAVPIKSMTLEVALAETPEQEPLPGHLGFCFWTSREAFDRDCSVPLSVQVKSSIPEGAGLGSSAALSLAMARAMADAFRNPADDEALRRVSMACERQAHGKPSGIDTEVCLLAQPVWAQPGSPFKALGGDKIERIGLIVLGSGPGGATSEMIRKVSGFRDSNPERFQSLTSETRNRSSMACEALLSGDVHTLGRLLNQQHEALCEIGVSTEGLDTVVACARDLGAAGAKLSGAGGGGVAVAVAPVEEVRDLAGRLRREGCQVLSAGPMVDSPDPPAPRRLS
jgi:mevalonate kinase